MKKRILQYLRNIIGYFIMLSGFLTAITINLISGLSITLIGLMMTTHCYHLFKKSHISLKRKNQIIISVMILFIAAGAIFSDFTNLQSYYEVAANESQNKTKQNIKKDTKTSNIKIHFIDTGNSDCTFVETQDKNLLIDGGDNDDEQRIVNYLKNLNVSKIDYLVSTHPDADHCGGLDAIVTNFNIGQTYVSNGSSTSKTYRDFIYSLSAKGLTPAVPLEDKKIKLDDQSSIQFYNTKATGTGNELSLVTLLKSGNHRMLFMADATKNVEKNILDKLPSDIDILKVSHHGSSSATSETFLKALDIRYAVIECGKNNKYNHPDQKVIKRLKNHDIKTLRTDKKGNIIFTLKNKKLSYKFTKTTSNKGSAPVDKDPSDNIQQQEQSANEQETQIQQQNSVTVYIAGSGDGTKYHSNPNCSHMKDPVAISKSEAQNRGYEPCKKCY